MYAGLEIEMDWIFPAFVPAAVLHILEEYVFPGGFPDFLRSLAPRFASYITTGFAIRINGGFLLLCVSAARLGAEAPVFSLSVAALLFVNGLTHVLSSLRTRGYSPGMITGALLYMPLAVTAYALVLHTVELTAWQIVLSILIGIAYQAVPLSVLALSANSERR
jgi:hypothetical protein